MASPLQLLANPRTDTALPDDSVIDRPSGLPLPQDPCLTLITDADGSESAGR